jgi:Tol biopolymer transport system component
MGNVKYSRFLGLAQIIGLILIFVLSNESAFSQGFGRNKPGYKTFDFKVYKTPHFEIYHYFDNDSVIQQYAEMAEKWYFRHQQIFQDTFKTPNPVIIYENHPDFQQTTAISGIISIGTGGVTESLKNRVVFPVLETNAQTNHVFGHELVHAFQFSMLTKGDTTSIMSVRNLPLWMVEGMAEYLSIGSFDPNTAMWMRDALANDDFPTLKDLTTSYKYFPYRWGHAFWAFVCRTWGDDIMAPLFMETAKFGYERAIESVLGMKPEVLSNIWKSSYTVHYKEFMEDSLKLQEVGTKLLFEGNSGETNVSPSLSPDGKYVAFFSEKNVFTLDLFVADAETGKILTTLTSSSRSDDIDGFNFLESMGTWSPDSRYFAYVAVKKGKSVLLITDLERRSRKPEEIFIPGVSFINNPSWSPDGTKLVMTGVVGGINNLYLYDLETTKVTRLTNDGYSYIHPTWSPDMKYIAFSTDRKQPGDTTLNPSYSFNLGIMEYENPTNIQVLPVFRDAHNLNPQYSQDGASIYFVSNRDGFRNLYRYDKADGKVFRLTDFLTGISGITEFAPAVSVSRLTDKITFTYYFKGNHTIYSAASADFNPVEVEPSDIDFTAATLPPFQRISTNIVDNLMVDYSDNPVFPADSFQVKPYRPKFKLDYIGNTGVGISVNTYYGTGMAGGVNAIFSDILGNSTLYSALAVNGEIYDFGGMFAYFNQKRKIKWGVSLSHIPYRQIYPGYPYEETIKGIDYIVYPRLDNRIFEDQLGLFAYFPFSMTRRLELGVSSSFYYYMVNIYKEYYQDLGGYLVFAGSDIEKNVKEKPPSFNLQRLNLAYVGDNSYFGMASPMRGHRYRFQVDKYFGSIDRVGLTADARKYVFLKPFSFAIRGLHMGRYGKDQIDPFFYPIYLGYPGFVRGLNTNAYLDAQRLIDSDYNGDDLLGAKMLFTSFEVRLPFTGPEKLAVIKSGVLFAELALFFDAGLAFNDFDDISFNVNTTDIEKRLPVFSTGVSLRVNLFGYMILEPYYAFPINRTGMLSGVFGLNFIPGW